MIEKEKFERHLRGTNLSENTISSYLFAIKQYGEQYDDVTQKKLLSTESFRMVLLPQQQEAMLTL